MRRLQRRSGGAESAGARESIYESGKQEKRLNHGLRGYYGFSLRELAGYAA